MPKEKRKRWQIFGTVSHPQIAKRLMHWLDLDDYPDDMKLTDTIQAVVSIPYPDNWHQHEYPDNQAWICPRGTYEIYVKLDAIGTIGVNNTMIYSNNNIQYVSVFAPHSVHENYSFPTTTTGTRITAAHNHTVPQHVTLENPAGTFTTAQHVISEAAANETGTLTTVPGAIQSDSVTIVTLPHGWILTEGDQLLSVSLQPCTLRYRRIA